VLPTLDSDILQTFCSELMYSKVDPLAKKFPGGGANFVMEYVEFKFASESIFELGNNFMLHILAVLVDFYSFLLLV